MSSDIELKHSCEELKKIASDPLKRPIYLVLLTIVFGVIIGGLLSCFGINGINFVLFSAPIVGAIYASIVGKTICAKTCIKCGIYYFFIAVLVTFTITKVNPSLLSVNSINMFLFVLTALIFESILFGLFLYLGTALYLHTEPQNNTKTV